MSRKDCRRTEEGRKEVEVGRKGRKKRKKEGRTGKGLESDRREK